MTSKLVKKSYHASAEVAERIEAEASARGISVSAYSLQCIEAQMNQTGTDGGAIDPRISDIICSTTDKGFGDEHILQRLDRRCHMIQSLCASIISEIADDDRAMLVADILKKQILEDKHAA